MRISERIIAFQNRAERDFQGARTAASTLRYVLAALIFFGSTMVAGISWPFRAIAALLRRTPSDSAQTSGIADILESQQRVLLYFWAEWCGPCLMMKPVLQELGDGLGVSLVKVNADANADLVRRFGVRGLPQFVLLEDGAERRRHAGPMTAAELQRFVDDAHQA